MTRWERFRCRIGWHSWAFSVGLNTGAYTYCECRRCGRRKAWSLFWLHGPRNDRWLNGGEWDDSRPRLPPRGRSVTAGQRSHADKLESAARMFQEGVGQSVSADAEWRWKLSAEIDAAKAALPPEFRITGQPLPDAVKELADAWRQTDDENARLRTFVDAQAERIARQSDLLSRKAEKV